MERKALALCLFVSIFLTWVAVVHAASQGGGVGGGNSGKSRVIYPKKTELDFEGLRIEGETNSPGEFYFQHKPEEKFDSLVKRRKNFHREMLRDAVLSR